MVAIIFFAAFFGHKQPFRSDFDLNLHLRSVIREGIVLTIVSNRNGRGWSSRALVLRARAMLRVRMRRL